MGTRLEETAKQYLAMKTLELIKAKLTETEVLKTEAKLIDKMVPLYYANDAEPSNTTNNDTKANPNLEETNNSSKGRERGKLRLQQHTDLAWRRRWSQHSQCSLLNRETPGPRQGWNKMDTTSTYPAHGASSRGTQPVGTRPKESQ